jgi:uncharacterized protein (TIGR02246 family)
MRIRTFLLCGVLVASTMNVVGQSGGEDQAVRKFFADADVAWNNHDAKQLTNPRNATADADFVNVYGGWAKGQESFVPIMTRLQAGPFHDVRRHTIVEKIRFVRPDVAVVIATIVDRHGEGPPAETRATFVLSKEQGLWLLNSFQNTQITAPPGPLSGPPGGSPPPGSSTPSH